jgi:hypothetical protein
VVSRIATSDTHVYWLRAGPTPGDFDELVRKSKCGGPPSVLGAVQYAQGLVVTDRWVWVGSGASAGRLYAFPR